MSGAVILPMHQSRGVQAEAGAEGQARQRGAAEPRGEGSREGMARERGGREAAEPPTHTASPMVLRCIVGE